MAITLNNPPGPAAVTAVADKILDDTTVLGVAGTIAAAVVTLDHLGGIDGDSTILAGCNIGTVTLVDCYGVGVASSLDLSDNRMAAGVTATSGLLFLLEQLYAAIDIGNSGAFLTLDMSGNAVPDAATMALVYDLCKDDSCDITVELPTTYTATAVPGDAPDPDCTGDYNYESGEGAWLDEALPSAVYRLYHDGTQWVVTDFSGNTWTHTGDTPDADVFTPEGEGTGTFTMVAE